MSKMTRWFPPHIKPCRTGVYQIKFTPKGSSESYDPFYATWNGKKWSCISYNLWGENHKQFDSLQSKYWRGFTKEQT